MKKNRFVFLPLIEKLMNTILLKSKLLLNLKQLYFLDVIEFRINFAKKS